MQYNNTSHDYFYSNQLYSCSFYYFRHCDEFPVLGFDCEWLTVGGTRRPVALLQLTTHRGLCALIRLSHLRMIPSELKVSYCSVLVQHIRSLEKFRLIRCAYTMFFRLSSGITGRR